MDEDNVDGLGFARRLIRLGVPIFLARPWRDGDEERRNVGGFVLPGGWQRAVPDEKILERWRPGMALCATGNGPISFVDIDPRSGGAESYQAMVDSDLMPDSWATVRTPSGGTHEYVWNLGVRSRDGIRPGVDIKAGVGGDGVGFVFLPPTVKVPKSGGEARPYVVETEDLSGIEDLIELGGRDDSGEALAAEIELSRNPGGITAEYDGPEYEDMSEAQQAMVDEYRDGFEIWWRESAQRMLALGEGERDGKGRGWEAWSRDLAYAVATLTTSGWSGMEDGDGEELFETLQPEEMRATTECSGKWTGSLLAKASTQGDHSPPWDRPGFVSNAEDYFSEPIEGVDQDPTEGLGSGDGGGGEAGGGGGDDLYKEWDILGDVHLAKRVALKLKDGNRRPIRAWADRGWACWTGKRWDVDYASDLVRGRVIRALLQIGKTEEEKAQRRYDREVAKLEGEPEAVRADKMPEIEAVREEALKRLGRLTKVSAVDMVMKLMRANMHVDLSLFDGPQTADWLNADNGMVNLRTGELADHDPAMLFTHVCPVGYVADATSEDWSKALTAIPEDIRPWLQKRFGQAVTGHTVTDDVIPFLWGGGANGKSTILTGVTRALGGFYTVVPNSVILQGNDSEVAMTTLRGVRLAILEELPGNDKWLDVEQMKRLVGTEVMTGRVLYKGHVQWTPTHSLMITTNYQIQVRETDKGTWRRLARVPFPYTFDGSDARVEADGGLRERVKLNTDKQQEAALAWMVAGAVASYQEPLTTGAMPEAVKESTREWRLTGNAASRFIGEYLRFNPSGAELSSNVYKLYAWWAKETGQKPMGDQIFWTRVAGCELFESPGVDRTYVRLGSMQTSDDAGVDTSKPHRLVTAVSFTEEGWNMFQNAGIF